MRQSAVLLSSFYFSLFFPEKWRATSVVGGQKFTLPRGVGGSKGKGTAKK